MSGGSFTTFAYGSNMPTTRLRERGPSATLVGVAKLKGYELRWHKRSRDGSGKCDIVPATSPEARVLGVLYRIAEYEKRNLDRAEGLGHGYAEIDIEVLCDGTPIAAKAYQATDIDHSLRPYSWYRALVVAGAREHRIPEDYIALLEAVATQEDPDRTRHAMNMRLIDGGAHEAAF